MSNTTDEKKSNLDFIACKMYFEKNNCNNTNCRFSHDIEVWKKNKESKKLPCLKYFGFLGNAKCTYGEYCLYSHNYDDCANKPCPRHFGLKNFEKNSCTSMVCPFSHNDGGRKTFIENDKEIKAAGILLYKIINEEKLFYLVAEKDMFSEPGGKLLVNDETPLCGAHREFEEETGIKCPFWDFTDDVHYLENAKYLLFVKKVSMDFDIPGSGGKFLNLKDLNLHPRSKEFILGMIKN